MQRCPPSSEEGTSTAAYISPYRVGSSSSSFSSADFNEESSAGFVSQSSDEPSPIHWEESTQEISVPLKADRFMLDNSITVNFLMGLGGYPFEG